MYNVTIKEIHKFDFHQQFTCVKNENEIRKLKKQNTKKLNYNGN